MDRETIFALSEILSKIVPVLLVVGSLAVLGVVLYGRYRQTRGPNVIAIGRYDSPIIILLIAVFIFYLTYRLFESIANDDLGPTLFLEFIVVGLLLLFFIGAVLSKVYILDDGIISYYFERMYWGDIGAYYWDEKDPNLLHIFKKHYRSRHYKIRIPGEKRERVKKLLETYLKSSEIT